MPLGFSKLRYRRMASGEASEQKIKYINQLLNTEIK